MSSDSKPPVDWGSFDVWPHHPLSHRVARIHQELADQPERMREALTKLFGLLLRKRPEYGVWLISRFPDWTETQWGERVDSRDSGADLVAELDDGDVAAIRCDCTDDFAKVERKDVFDFGSKVYKASDGFNLFDRHWLVSAGEWGEGAEAALRVGAVDIERIDLRKYRLHTLAELRLPLHERNEPRMKT